MKQFFFSIPLIFSALAMQAQRPNFGGGGGGGFPGTSSGGFGSFGGSQGSGTPGKVTLDTSDIFFFYADNPHFVFPFSDSLLETLHQYDPIRQRELDYANLGNLGSAARPLFFQPTWRRGFDVGLHQFDLYQMRTSDVRYYQITQAYTQAWFTQGPSQANAQFGVRFSRNFADGLNLSIEHRRINNEGAYDNQKALDSDVAAGLWFHHKNGRYDGFFSFVTNSARQKNNGGVAENLDGRLVAPLQVDIRLQNSQTRHANSELAYTQYFYFNRTTAAGGRPPNGRPEQFQAPPLIDSTTNRPPPPTVSRPLLNLQRPTPSVGRQYTFYHQIAWRTESYKFYDTAPDSTYYGDFRVDERGLRVFLETKKLENTFKLQTFKLRNRPDGRPAESDLLELGLVHSAHFLMLEPVDTGAIHNFFLTGRLHFSPGEGLRAQTYAHLGVGANAGDYRLGGELFFTLKKVGNLRFEAVNQLYSPSLLPSRLFISKQEFWKNNWQRTLETSLSGTYSFPGLHFSATGQYHLLSHYIYFDEQGLPRQSGAFSILQWMARQDFHVAFAHLENWICLQKVTSDVLPLPKFYSKHSLYLQGKIFKKVMLTKIGLDARLFLEERTPTYMPLIGQFVLQRGKSLPFTPLLDAFLSFRVKTFRFFVKAENILSYPLHSFYYQTTDYPLPFGFTNGGLRMGVNWRLVD